MRSPIPHLILAMLLVSLALAAPLTVTPAPAATERPTIPVASCPTVIPRGAIGVLQSDMQCAPGIGIRLQHRAVLDLNGHTLTSAGAPSLGAVAVLCESRCGVFGPGRIVGDGGFGIAADTNLVDVRDAEISGVDVGIFGYRHVTLRLTNVSIAAGYQGIWAYRRVFVDHVDIAVAGPDPGPCVETYEGRVIGTDLAVTGCYVGVQGKRVKLTNLTVTDSARGVSARMIRLVGSSVTGSAVYDLFATRMPRLESTICGTSRRFLPDGTFGTWAVCSND